MEPLAIERGDAASLLTAMLQGVQTERRDRAGLRRVENAEDPAFQPGLVIVGITQVVGVLGG